MSVNEGTIDRVIRVVVGVALVVWVLSGPQEGWRLLAWLGLIPLATGLIGFCPAYRLLGTSTCPASKKG